MPTCTTAALNIACFRGYNLSRLQRKAFRIWYLLNELAQNGGQNFTNAVTVGTNSLRYAAKQSFDHWNRDEVDEGFLAVDYNNAVNAGAIVSNNPSTVMVSVRRLLNNVGEDDMNKMILYLECALGAHRKPPL
jgi:hypothetical protein